MKIFIRHRPHTLKPNLSSAAQIPCISASSKPSVATVSRVVLHSSSKSSQINARISKKIKRTRTHRCKSSNENENEKNDNHKDISSNDPNKCCQWKPFYKYLILFAFVFVFAAITAVLIALSQLIKFKTTTTTTTTTTTVVCAAPFVATPSQTCVNLMIDFKNCGSVGYVCSSNYTSCSAGICSKVPGVRVTNPVPVIYTLNNSIDDQIFNVNLPFNITIYNVTKDRITVTSNGVLCFEQCASTYTETKLPTSAFSGATVLAYWDDLYITRNTSQGIYYGTNGTKPNRSLIVEYYMSHYAAPLQFYHFQVVFYEASPGIVQFIYFESYDLGASCTVGVQASKNGSFIQHTYNQTNSILPNMTLIFDTNIGSYSTSFI